MGRARREAGNSNALHVENTVAHAKEEMGIQKTGRNEMPLRTFRLSHEGQSFCVTSAKRGRILQ
jgi:hypothetical protein